MAKFMTLQEAVKENIKDGDFCAFEGFTHLIPYAAGHEVIRQGIKNLTIVRMTPDIIYDQLIGMGLVKKLIFSWGGNPGVGSLHRMREEVEAGRLEIEEHSHAALANAYEAGASNLPFAVFRGYKGVDLPKVNPKIKSVKCPYTGEKLATVPSIRPDVGIIHALKADKKGNVLIEGILGVQKETVLASKRSIITVEEVVEDFGDKALNACILPHWAVGAVCVVKGGAYPSYTQGYYPRNNAFYIAWDKISREKSSFDAWMKENVLNKTPDDFEKLAYKK